MDDHRGGSRGQNKTGRYKVCHYFCFFNNYFTNLGIDVLFGSQIFLMLVCKQYKPSYHWERTILRGPQGVAMKKQVMPRALFS